MNALTSTKRPSNFIVAAVVLANAVFVRGQSGHADLRATLNAYEAAAEKLGVSGSPLERAQSIKALAAVVSPLYPSVRDRLAKDPARDVRIALLDSISRMGDSSPSARAIVIDSVRSHDTGVVARALNAVRQIGLRLDFGDVWQPGSALATWSQWEGGFGPSLEQVDGIAIVRPWKDRAWRDLSENARLSLLSRAGSREAMTLLAKALENTDSDIRRPWKGWVPAEAVDRQLLRELIDDGRPEISTLAAFSLVKAKDSEQLARIGRCLIRLPSDSGSTVECPASMMDEQVLRAAMPSFDRETLLALERRDPLKWFWAVEVEFRGRADFLSYEELKARVPAFESLRTGDAKGAGAELDSALKNALLAAIMREHRYEALAPGDFQKLWPTPEFLAGLPADIAHENYLGLKAWIGDRKPDQYRCHSDDAGICAALRALGLVARGDDYEELWRDFLADDDPLRNLQRLIPVVWGVAQRSDTLRHLLAKGQRENWFQHEDSLYDLLAATEADPSPDPCNGRPQSVSWDPFRVPSETLSFAALKKALASDLETIDPARDLQVLSRDFLELRGLGEEVHDPVEALKLLWDPRESIRVAANRLFKDAPPLGLAAPNDPNSSSARAWVATMRVRLKGFSLIHPDLPGPALDGEQRGQLETIIKKSKARFFDAWVEQAHQRPYSIQASTPALVPLPYAGFLMVSPEFFAEVRSLLLSSDVDLRHGAAWALWLRVRDGAALRVFLEDSRNADVMVRARALHVLEVIRSKEAAPLFPPLLKDSSPELRQVGLWGVKAFRIRSALPEVESLVLDDNAAVSGTAIEVLGSLRPPEARTLLLRLLGGEPGPRASKASIALAQFRTVPDIDALVTCLADRSASDVERWMILGVLTKVTAHPCRQTWDPDSFRPPVAPLAPETIHDWQAWWSHHRSEKPGDRLKNTVAALVEQFVKGDDRAATMALRLLARLVPALTGYPFANSGTPSAKERELVQRWWRDARYTDAWTLISSYGTVPETNLDLAMEIDPQRTRQQLIEPLLRDVPTAGDSPHLAYPSAWHATLAQFADVDFGDPVPALCDARERIVTDWLAWARKEGWAR